MGKMAIEKLIDKVNANLIEKGFSKKNILNNRGLIDATISEVINEIHLHIPK